MINSERKGIIPSRIGRGLMFVPTVGLIRVPVGLSVSGASGIVEVYSVGQKRRCRFSAGSGTAVEWMAALKSGVSWLETYRTHVLTRRTLKEPVKGGNIPGPGCPGVYMAGKKYAVYDPLNQEVIIKPTLHAGVAERLQIVEMYVDTFAYEGLEIIA